MQNGGCNLVYITCKFYANDLINFLNEIFVTCLIRDDEIGVFQVFVPLFIIFGNTSLNQLY